MVVKKTKKRLVRGKRTKKRSQVGWLKNKPMPGMPVKNIYLPSKTPFDNPKKSSPINLTLFKSTNQTPFTQKQTVNPSQGRGHSFRKPYPKRPLILPTHFKPQEPYKRPPSELKNNKFEKKALAQIRGHQGTNEITTGYVTISPLLRNTKSPIIPYNSNPLFTRKFTKNSTDKYGYTRMSAPENSNSKQYVNMSNAVLNKTKVNSIQGYIELNPEQNNYLTIQ